MAGIKVELLYFDGCPTYQTALKDIEDITKQDEIDAEITLVKVKSEEDAKRLQFLGSPTVRVNGVDLEPSSSELTDYGLRCRIYKVNGKLVGSPSKEMLRKALEAGLSGSSYPDRR